jgi:RNA polymerase sigma-B factor
MPSRTAEPPAARLLRDAAARLRAVDPGDTAGVLGAARHAVGAASAAGDVLERFADAEEYGPLRLNAQPVLEAVAGALGNPPAAPAVPMLVLEGPLNGGAAAAIRKRLLDVVDALDAALRRAAVRAASEADRKACQNGTVLLSELRDCYDGQPWGAARLARLSDDELLARCRVLPKDSQRHSAACELLVRRYEKLVRACVRQYSGSPEPVEDLMQVGYVGLLKAINNYDPAFGNGLRAYATPCVSGEIKRHFRDKRWQIHVRRPVQELLLQLRTVTEQLTHKLGRVPCDAELAKALGVTTDDILEARQAEQVFTTYSLDAPLSGLSGLDDPAELGDVIGDEDPGVGRTIDMEAVSQHWDELPRREQRILVLRFYGNLTQEEIGARLGISQMHVSRLLARALAHLRKRLVAPTQAPGRDSVSMRLRGVLRALAHWRAQVSGGCHRHRTDAADTPPTPTPSSAPGLARGGGTRRASSTSCTARTADSPWASLPTVPGARAQSCRGSSRCSRAPRRHGC